MEKVIRYHPDKCMACRSCELACSFKHEGEFNPQLARIFVMFEGPVRFPLTCLQCADAFCAKVCPTNAISLNRETGAKEVDQELCIGCRLCTLSCPFGLIVMGRAKKAVKCDLCGGDPECVKACTYGALEFSANDTEAMEKRSIVFEHIERTLEGLTPPEKPFSFPELKHG